MVTTGRAQPIVFAKPGSGNKDYPNRMLQRSSWWCNTCCIGHSCCVSCDSCGAADAPLCVRWNYWIFRSVFFKSLITNNLFDWIPPSFRLAQGLQTAMAMQGLEVLSHMLFELIVQAIGPHRMHDHYWRQ